MAGGWGTIAADFLAMASYAQVAGQYVFLLVGAKAIGYDATSPWVLMMGIGWIVVLTLVCYLGIQVSARLQVVLIVVEVILLAILSVTAFVKLASGSAPAGHLIPSWTWFDPFKINSFNTFMQGMLLMVFIYWGWDTTVSLNEESDEPTRIPGTAGVISTVILLVTYLLVIMSVQSYAGIGTHGIGLGNPDNQNDVLSVLGGAIFGQSGVGLVMSRLLILMVLTSTAATAQTTILPNARTTLSMAFHKALPDSFARVHPRFRSPTVSTIVFSVMSIVFYVIMNFVSGGNVIADSVSAGTFFIALYLGITGFACTWHYRRSLFTDRADAVDPGGHAPAERRRPLRVTGLEHLHLHGPVAELHDLAPAVLPPLAGGRRAADRHRHDAGGLRLHVCHAHQPARLLRRRDDAHRSLDHRRRPGGARDPGGGGGTRGRLTGRTPRTHR